MYDDDGDDDYYGWDYREPTEEEMLQVYIEDDADAEYGSNALMHRQQERWEEFLERNQKRYDQELKDLGQAQRERRFKRPTWWQLWTPPDGLQDLTVTSGDSTRTLRQGELTVNVERQFKDIHSYDWGGVPRSILASENWYLDFRPNAPHGVPDVSFLHKGLGVLSQDMMHGDWGWWAGDKIRTVIQGAYTRYDPEHLELGANGLDILATAPPPYGLWLPTFHGMSD